MQDYIDAAQATKSDKFYGERVGLFYFIRALKDAIDAANHLDAIKKSLFYGKPLYNVPEGHDWGGVNLAKIADSIHPDIIHAIVGGITETAEMGEALVKALEDILHARGDGIDETNLKEEAGDQLWYLAVLLKALDTTFTAEGRRNIAKLMKRFPDGFSEDNALVRDIAAERRILEGEAA